MYFLRPDDPVGEVIRISGSGAYTENVPVLDDKGHMTPTEVEREMDGSGGKYPFTIPPLYFYLIFPFTILGSNPSFLVLANGLFSFLAIPLLIYLVYQLLENVEFSKRILLASLAGFWYSTVYRDWETLKLIG